MDLHAPASFKTTFRALKSRNFRLFFAGQGISLAGTWMQQTAMSWLVYRLTGSPFWLGMVGFSGQIASTFLSPLAGVVIDRLDKRKLLLAAQWAFLAEALILAVLVYSAAVQLWQIVILSCLAGAINAVEIPCRQSLLVDLVDNKHDLGNAIALQSSLFNTTRLMGPAVAGLVIAAVGESACFLLNAASYLAILWALSAMRVAQKEPARHGRVWEGLVEGARYTFGFPPIRWILVFLALSNLLGTPFGILLPVFAKDIFVGGPRMLGFLMGAVGVGALAGAVYLASRPSVRGLLKMIPISSSLFVVGLVSFAHSRTLWLSVIFLALTGFGMMVQVATSNIILQSLTDDEKRGRVMSFFTFSAIGMSPFGSLLAGSLATHLGAPAALTLAGAACGLGAGIFAWHMPVLRRHIRPVYVRKGIIQESLDPPVPS